LFRVPRRVYWPESDAAGIVYFPNFFHYFEEAEEELFRALGYKRHDLLRDLGIFMPRVDCQCRFRSPARPGDLLEIGIGVDVVNPRRLLFRFEVRRSGEEALLVEGGYRVACTTRELKPADFPAPMLSLLARVPGLIAAQPV
jgi:acyl-CoA thioester hydrolase